MSSMIVKHLSWVITGAEHPDRVIKGYQVKLQDALNTLLPNPILNFFYKLTSGRKGFKKARAHGIGVHAQDELGKSDLRVLSDLLFEKPFIFGNEPILLTVVAFVNLAQLHYTNKEVEHPLRDAMNEPFPKLVGLVTHVLERTFPDWEEMAAPMAAEPLPKAAEDKDGTAIAEKQPLKYEPEKGKGDEKEKEHEKEPEEKNEKENEKEK